MSASVSCEALCRLCLSSRGRLLPIFGGPDPGDLAGKIRACVAVQVKEDDELPTRVCAKCLDNVNNWHLFKKVCDRSQVKLAVLTKKESSHLEPPLKIKSEPLNDEIYDDEVVIDAAYPDYEQNASANKIQPEGPPILASLGLAPRSDKKLVDPRLDWHRVEAILNLVQDDEVIDALQLAEELDNVQYSDHDSDSEGDLISDVEDEYLDSKDCYISKDRRVLARMPKLSISDYNAKMKISTHLKRPNPAENIHFVEPKHAWRVFFTKEMLDYIVECSNEHIVATNSPDLCISVAELEAVVGILYLHGVSRAFHHQRSELWGKGIGLRAVVGTMSQDRFLFVLENLRFEKEALMTDKRYDVLKPIRTILERFTLNCRTSFEVGSHVVVDEKIDVIFGPCPFRIKLMNKPMHCGIKFVTLVDPSTFYVSNLDIITDRTTTDPADCLKRLVQHLAGTGKTVVMNSWFTTVDLIQSLLREYRLYTIAALKPTDAIIPPFFISTRRSPRTFMTAFVDSDIAMTSFVNSQRKAVNILSSHPKYYKRSSLDSKTPVSQYKQYQSAGEVMDVLTNYYTTAQHTNNWALSLFFTLLDIASINAQVLWLSRRGESVIQRNIFMRMMALGLLEGQQEGSDNIRSNDNVGEASSSKRGKYSEKQARDLVASGVLRLRCRLCIRHKRNRKTRYVCMNCGLPMCGEHTSSLCVNCAPKYVDS